MIFLLAAHIKQRMERMHIFFTKLRIEAVQDTNTCP